MAVFIKATYVKKLGLPQYSSHQYSVEVSAELTDLTQLPQASADLYARLADVTFSAHWFARPKTSWWIATSPPPSVS